MLIVFVFLGVVCLLLVDWFLIGLFAGEFAGCVCYFACCLLCWRVVCFKMVGCFACLDCSSLLCGVACGGVVLLLTSGGFGAVIMVWMICCWLICF